MKYTPAGGHVVVTTLGRLRRRRPDRGPGRRPRHRSRAPRAGVRALLPGRQGQEPRARRDRARARDRQAPGREHRRPGHRSTASPAEGRPSRSCSPRHPSRPRLVLAAMRPWAPLLLSVVAILHLAAPGTTAGEPVDLLLTGGTVVTMDSAFRVLEDGGRRGEGRAHRGRGTRARARGPLLGREDDRHHRPDRDAGPGQHPHPRADDAVSRRGRRRGAHGLAHEVHLAGGSRSTSRPSS